MHRFLSLAPWLLLLSSCTSPPQPPKVDPTTRHPVNSIDAVNLQTCQGDLRNTRLLANESSKRAEISSTNVERLLARQRAVDARSASSCASANVVFTVLFDFGSTRIEVPPDVRSALVDAARDAPLVQLRGRTDGSIDSPADSRIARQRAAAMRDWLVAAGVPSARIRTTHQPSGDTTADNATPTGQRLNRRVEIEVYLALPVLATTNIPSAP